jgi:hypothetical protein
MSTYLERGKSMSRLLTGREASQDEIADNLMLYGPERRVQHLQQFDEELEKLPPSIAAGSNRMREAAELLALRRKLGDRHDVLRKVGR